MYLNVLPEGLSAAGAVVEALAARLAAAHAAASPVVSAVAPPAADAISLQSAVHLSATGIERNAAATRAVTELGRAGLGVEQVAASYVTGDITAAGTYLSSVV
ncbi:PE family protein [Mycobacteroides salmoniphilum]|uniref:PE family protein n=1 Tax=Mycobacteroides salmoniphilum TaxID=404941 RepID=UPI000992091F|nr:PE family protein [Mycobacteroides salmoniphilum]